MDDYARYYYSITSGHSWAPGLVTVPNSSQLAMNASVPAQETAPGTATTGSMPPRPLPYPPSYDYLPPGRPPAPPPRPPSYAPSYTGGAMYPSWGPVRPSQPPGYPPYYPPYSRPPPTTPPSAVPAKPPGMIVLETIEKPPQAGSAPPPAAPRPSSLNGPVATGTPGGDPPALVRYIARSLETGKTQQDREWLQAEIMRVVNAARADGTLHTKDWATMSLIRPPIAGQLQPAKVTAPPLPETSVSVGGGMFSLPSKPKRNRWGSEAPPEPLPPGQQPPVVPSYGSALNLPAVQSTKPSYRREDSSDSDGGYIPLSVGSVLKSATKKAKKAKMDLEALVPSSFASKKKQKQHPSQKKKKAEAIDTAAPFSEKELGSMKIVGTCETLEKSYFRLTAPPDPSTVRPLHVLKLAVDALKAKWKAGCTYRYACDQLKAIRQDLTVQQIRNEFTTEVYELHARIALERGDSNEFNQCQTQLIDLHDAGLSDFERRCEFVAYRLLYYIFNKADIDSERLMASLTLDFRGHTAVSHALQVRSAVAVKNFAKYFRLLGAAPNMSASVMEFANADFRIEALTALCKSCRVTIPVAFLTSYLSFPDDDTCREYVAAAGGVIDSDKDSLVTATSNISPFEPPKIYDEEEDDEDSTLMKAFVSS